MVRIILNCDVKTGIWFFLCFMGGGKLYTHLCVVFWLLFNLEKIIWVQKSIWFWKFSHKTSTVVETVVVFFLHIMNDKYYKMKITFKKIYKNQTIV